MTERVQPALQRIEHLPNPSHILWMTGQMGFGGALQIGPVPQRAPPVAVLPASLLVAPHGFDPGHLLLQFGQRAAAFGPVDQLLPDATVGGGTLGDHRRLLQGQLAGQRRLGDLGLLSQAPPGPIMPSWHSLGSCPSDGPADPQLSEIH